MNMEESSEIKRKQNRLTNKQTKKKDKEDKGETKKKSKKVGKDDEKGKSEVETVGHDEEGPPLKKPKRKLRKPTAEEDIIDGFAILAFKNYEELSRAIKLGENSDSRLCVQLLKRAEDGSVCKSVKDKKPSPKDKNSHSPKVKTPKTKSTTPNKEKETPDKMANKLPGGGSETEKKKRKADDSTAGNSKKKQRANNGPSTTKAKLHNTVCETSTEGTEVVSDGCTDLFAPTRKDSSPFLLDNLHSPHEPKGLDPQEPRINPEEDKEVRCSSPLPKGQITPTSSSTVTSANLVEPNSKTSQVLETSLSKSLTNGPLCLDGGGCERRDVNGHADNTDPESPERLSPVQPKTVQQTLFTPYATSAITRVSTGGGTSVPENSTTEQQSTKPNHSGQANSGCQTNSVFVQQASLSDFTLSGSHIHRSSLPNYDKTGTGTSPTLLTSSLIQRNSTTPTSKEISCAPTSRSSSATAFGSIARLLDSPNPPSSRNSPVTISASNALTQSTNDNNSLNHFYLSGSGGPSSAPQSCSSRSLSPRSHSPPRERDSYSSSNVSSLSRTSVTPVSGSSSLSQLPPNLSPLQSLSYSKAASWLSGVPPRLSPVPRPTPPPPILPPSSSGHLSSTGLSSHSGATPSPLSVFPSLVPGHTPPAHAAPPPVPISCSAMFAPPMLPLSSMMPHPSGQPVPFGPSGDSIFQAQSQSELVRRDLETRFLSPERLTGGSGGPGQFLSRSGDLHPHHQHLLSHLSGVNPMSPQNQPGTNPALYPPPMFKDLKMDSPFYRNLLSYPGFNGMLSTPPNLSTPFTSTSQMSSLTPKKTGKWNAMHVRIAWEIYQHQQKQAGSDKNGSNALGTNTSQPKGTSHPPTTTHSSTDLLRPPNHLFSGLSRLPEIGPPPFVAPLLSPHQPPHRGQFDPSQHPLFLHASQHLGPSVGRYPGFGVLGPTFGGLSGLGSSLLGRELASLNSLPTQEQWQRIQRGAPFAGGPGQGWPTMRPERESKTPTESRRHKDERAEKRYESDRHSDTKGGSRGASPFRDRSPVRPSRTPLENGDTDSRSSRSNDSHSTTVHTSKFRYKEDTNGDRDKPSTPHVTDKERDKSSHVGSISDLKNPLINYIPSTHPSRLFPAGSPMAPLTSWDSFPGFNPGGPRMSNVDSFRLSLLQLNERDKEYSARIQSTLLRPHYPNGPFMNMPLGGLGQLPSHPQHPPGGSSSGGSNASSSNSSTKSSPLGGMNSLSHHQQLSLHHSSSQNGCGSPSNKAEDRGKDN